MKTHRAHSFLVCGVVAALFLFALSACGGKAPATTKPTAPIAAPAPAPATPAAPTPRPAPAAPAAATPVAPSATARPARPQTPPLTGQVTRATLEAYPGWEELRARDYTPDPAAVASIKSQVTEVEALLFVASWCPDSRRDVPRLFKIMDQAGFPQSRVTMHSLDRTKKDAAGLTVKWNVERVPTFIFLRGDQEIGRVIERPTATLEADIAQILARK
jgi:thiol-disulfide isomerase/thioredoxin